MKKIVASTFVVSLFASMDLFAADDSHGDSHNPANSEFMAQGIRDEFEHHFSAPSDQIVGQISLDTNLDVEVERSILEDDERLKARLVNALETKNEPELIKFVDMNIGDSFKRRVLLTLGEIYEERDSPALLIALYEKFIMEFPRDKEIPKIFLRLGHMYREAGATNTALAKFYNVLNVALNVPIDELKDYQEVSHRAQLEIAETFFASGSYEKAAKFFKRLLRVELVDEDREMVMFKYAYTLYLSRNFTDAIISLGTFVNEFENSDYTGEARYLLSDSYTQLNDPKAALRETLTLLSAEADKINKNPEAWLYWKKRTGNQLANQFYHTSNFLDALTIYKAMVDLSNNPEWRWPVLYQIGLCYEKLEMKPKAMESYDQIVQDDQIGEQETMEDATLASIYEMAGWRRDRLDMDINTEVSLKSLIDQT
ncbi:MAG: tetratricopeptide repeat protein [Opitutales bacterium]|nr:tetratricopeptide repeat protein [Opitutales bacterium]